MTEKNNAKSRCENKFSPLELAFIFFSVTLSGMKNFVRHSEIIFASYPCDVNNY